MRNMLVVIVALFSFALGHAAVAEEKVCDAPISDGFFSPEQAVLKDGFGSYEGWLTFTFEKRERAFNDKSSTKRDEDFAWSPNKVIYTSTRCLRISLKRKGDKVVWTWDHGTLKIGDKITNPRQMGGIVNVFNPTRVWSRSGVQGFNATFNFNPSDDSYHVHWREPDGRIGDGVLKRVTPSSPGQVATVLQPQ
jgi:hypothetical protein